MAEQDVLFQEIRELDSRVTRVEAELVGVHAEVTAQRKEISVNKEIAEKIDGKVELVKDKVTEVHIAMAGLTGSHKMLLWILGSASVIITGLEFWAAFKA